MAVTLLYLEDAAEAQAIASELMLELADITAEEILRAERDTDRVLGDNVPRDRETGRKLDPSFLAPYELAALKRAIVYQVAFRREMPAEFFQRPSYDKVAAEGFTREGTLPTYSKAGWAELIDVSLPSRITTLDGGRAYVPSWFELGWSSPLGPPYGW